MSGPTDEMWSPYGSDKWYAMVYNVGHSQAIVYGGPFATEEEAKAWVQDMQKKVKT